MENTKICSKCGKELPLSEFSKAKNRKDGLQAWCKECRKQYNKQWSAEHADERAAYDAERRATLEGYAYNARWNNLYADRKRGRIGKDEDPLPPLSYHIDKFSEGIDYYDGKKYPFNELGFDRKDDKLPHIIDNMVVATTFHNRDRHNKRMTVEEYREYIQQQLKENELELVL